MKKDNSDFDYLQSMVSEQIEELRNLGPIAYDILKSLLPPTGATDIEGLVAMVVKLDRPVAQVEPDMLNMRSNPGVNGAVIKSLRRGSQLILLDQGSEPLVGISDQWLHVQDMDGSQGYILGKFVSRVKSYEDPSAKIDKIMETLEYFSRLDLVDITQEKQNYRIMLTSKGKNIADILFKPA